MRLRHIASVLSPVILIIGCDLIPQAYDTGYGCGYQFVDSYFACTTACQEQRQEREAEVLEWRGACQGSAAEHFSTQPPIDDANRQCSSQYFSQSRLVVCDDVGQEPGTHPPECEPFIDPTFGTTAGNYACPSAMNGGESKLCLCCEGAVGQGCDLPGGFCRDDDECCSGRCIFEEPEPPPFDAGFEPPPSGSCE